DEVTDAFIAGDQLSEDGRRERITHRDPEPRQNPRRYSWQKNSANNLSVVCAHHPIRIRPSAVQIVKAVQSVVEQKEVDRYRDQGDLRLQSYPEEDDEERRKRHLRECVESDHERSGDALDPWRQSDSKSRGDS